MEVHFSPDVELRLQQVASANGKDAEQLVKETVSRMLENQARFIAGVQQGIDQADRGELVERAPERAAVGLNHETPWGIYRSAVHPKRTFGPPGPIVPDL